MEVVDSNPRKLIPSAGEAYSVSWNIMWKSFITLLVVAILYGIISGPTAMLQWKTDGFDGRIIPVMLFGLGFALLITGPVGYSTKWVFLKAVRGEPVDIRDMFVVFQRNYWNAVVANVLVGLIVGIGFFMLIIPGIIFACRLAFVPYLIIDREMDISSAIDQSWKMTKGYGWQIFFMGIMAIVIVILGFLALFVGVIISVTWIMTAFAAFYQAVIEQEGYFKQ